jgi:DNA-binding XRE family transcriptional regulator
MVSALRGWTLDEVVAEFSKDPAFARAWVVDEAKAILGSNVAIIRFARDLSQKDLAEAVGIRAKRIVEIEQGCGNPRYDTLARIAAALHVEVAELVSRKLPVAR